MVHRAFLPWLRLKSHSAVHPHAHIHTLIAAELLCKMLTRPPEALRGSVSSARTLWHMGRQYYESAKIKKNHFNSGLTWFYKLMQITDNGGVGFVTSMLSGWLFLFVSVTNNNKHLSHLCVLLCCCLERLWFKMRHNLTLRFSSLYIQNSLSSLQI